MSGVHLSITEAAPVPIVLTTSASPQTGDLVIDHARGGHAMKVTEAGNGTLTTSDGQQWPATRMDVVATPGEAVRAGLRTVHTQGAGARHLLIRGENAHAASVLEAEHAGTFDLIYLDPPYDTGGSMSYADDREDWADFFHARLVRARRLLKEPSGVVIIAIDDRRLAWARLIADAVMGEDSFVANVIWDGGVHGQARLVSTAHDYMLIYVASPTWYRDNRIRWREPKDGAEQVMAAARRIWDGDPASSRASMCAWFKTLGADNPARALYLYCCFDDRGRLYREGPVSKPGGNGYRYDVHHPATGLPVVPPSTGWRYSPARMEQMLAEDRIAFRADHTTCVATRLYLDEQSTQVPSSVFTWARTRAAKRLAEQVGKGKFTYPKDTGVLARWFQLATRGNTSAKIGDLFAGSGATAEAVMELNSLDGGVRTSISITNNELPTSDVDELLAAGVPVGSPQWEERGLFEQVTRPRLQLAAATHDQHLEVAHLILGAGEHLVRDEGRVDEISRLIASA